MFAVAGGISRGHKTMIRMFAGIVFVVLAALLVGGGCRQVLDLEERTVGRCHVYDFTDEACSVCMDTCCEEASACRADPACDALWICRTGCAIGDEACLAECERDRECEQSCTGNESACRQACDEPLTQAGAALRACAANRCAAACQLGCGPHGVEGQGCGCADDCCEQARACARSEACGLLEVCRDACAEVSSWIEASLCRERCSNDFPEGASLQRSYDECIARQCRPESDWSCIGEVAWHVKPRGGAIELSVEGISHSSVTACMDASCASPGPALELTSQFGVLSVFVESGSHYPGPLLVEYPTGLPKTLFHLRPPAAENRHIEVLPRSIGEIAAFQDVTLVPALGHLQVRVLDCRGQNAPFVTVIATSDGAARPSDPEPVTLYGTDGGDAVFTPEKWSSQLTQTSSNSLVLFLNLRPGKVTVRAVVNGLCRESARDADLVIVPGQLTVADMAPSP